MKRTYPFLLTGLVVVAIVAPMAQGFGQANPVAGLEKKVKALTTRVTALESQASKASADAAAARSELAAAQANVATLQTGGTALQSAVSTLQSSVATLTSGLQCVRYKVLPVSRYGGYLYTNDGGKSVGLVTALDVTSQGQSTNIYAALVNPSCVGSSLLSRPASFERSSVEAFNRR